MSHTGHADPLAVRRTRPELLLSDRHLQVYLIKQLTDGRNSSQQASGAGAASSPSVGESPHSGAGGTEHQLRILSGGRRFGGGGGMDTKALLALDGGERVRLLSLLVQLETQMLAVQARMTSHRPLCNHGGPLVYPPPNDLLNPSAVILC